MEDIPGGGNCLRGGSGAGKHLPGLRTAGPFPVGGRRSRKRLGGWGPVTHFLDPLPPCTLLLPAADLALASGHRRRLQCWRAGLREEGEGVFLDVTQESAPPPSRLSRSRPLGAPESCGAEGSPRGQISCSLPAAQPSSGPGQAAPRWEPQFGHLSCGVTMQHQRDWKLLPAQVLEADARQDYSRLGLGHCLGLGQPPETLQPRVQQGRGEVLEPVAHRGGLHLSPAGLSGSSVTAREHPAERGQRPERRDGFQGR